MPLVVERFECPDQVGVTPGWCWFDECQEDLYPRREMSEWKQYEILLEIPQTPSRTAISSELWHKLPTQLDHIRQRIQESQTLLQLEDDWDEAGSPAIDEQTWRRAAEFLARQAKWIWEHNGRVVNAPRISPGPDGSIDLHWDHSDYELLINIPSDENAMAGFYGDDRDRISIKGRFDSARVNEGLINWLTKAG